MKTILLKKMVLTGMVAMLGFSLSAQNVAAPLKRGDAAAHNVDPAALDRYLKAVEASGIEMHSVMVLRNGEVLMEHWWPGYAPDRLHPMHSVSKTWTAMAVGFAVSEGRLKVTDKVIGFFPEHLPAEISDNLRAMEVRDLLTMTTGHDVAPDRDTKGADGAPQNWLATFFATPVVHKPGTRFLYNSLATYTLSAIVQRVTGEKVFDYLQPRLFGPLGITGIRWSESPEGITAGGWGLELKTEDMARFGQFLLQKGAWNDRQLLPREWIETATSAVFKESYPSGMRWENRHKLDPETSDWIQGYGYQIWRNRFNSYRAAGAKGQFILVLPEKNAVIVTTAHMRKMQDGLNLVWEHLLPAIR